MVIEITQGHVRLEIDQKIVTVQGEASVASYGKLDFIVYSNSIQCWDAPDADEVIGAEMKRRILDEVVAEFQGRGMRVEID